MIEIISIFISIALLAVVVYAVVDLRRLRRDVSAMSDNQPAAAPAAEAPESASASEPGNWRDIAKRALEANGLSYQEDGNSLLFVRNEAKYLIIGPEDSPAQRLVLPGILTLADLSDSEMCTLLEIMAESHQQWGPKITYIPVREKPEDALHWHISIVYDFVLTPDVEQQGAILGNVLKTFEGIALNFFREVKKAGFKPAEEAPGHGHFPGGISDAQLN